MIERTIAATTHGRYLVEPPAAGGRGAGLLVGFHGYAEGAEIAARADARDSRRRIAGGWSSIQGLHRFYQRRDERGRRQLDDASGSRAGDRRQPRLRRRRDRRGRSREWPGAPRVVLAGFSQGVAMAFRAAAAAPRRSTASSRSAATCRRSSTPPRSPRVTTALVCRGARDEWYTDGEVRATTSRRLREAGADGARRWRSTAATSGPTPC